MQLANQHFNAYHYLKGVHQLDSVRRGLQKKNDQGWNDLPTVKWKRKFEGWNEGKKENVVID